jgi:hypothetical protein
VTTADTWSPGRPRTQAIALLAACLVLLAAGAITDTGRVPGWEQAVFHAINGLPDALPVPMWLFQLLGLLFVPAIVDVVGGAAAGIAIAALAHLAIQPFRRDEERRSALTVGATA